MGEKTYKSRACDTCGAETLYPVDECDSFYNSWGKTCYAAPKKDMIVLSIPVEDSPRDYFNFCSTKCLKTYVQSSL